MTSLRIKLLPDVPCEQNCLREKSLSLCCNTLASRKGNHFRKNTITKPTKYCLADVFSENNCSDIKSKTFIENSKKLQAEIELRKLKRFFDENKIFKRFHNYVNRQNFYNELI